MILSYRRRHQNACVMFLLALEPPVVDKIVDLCLQGQNWTSIVIKYNIYARETMVT